MRQSDTWLPSKFVQRDGRLRASRDPRHLGTGSRLAGELVAQCYERQLRQHARGRLLDLGCGSVPLYAAYRPLVQQVTCVDWRSSEHVDVCADLCEALPFADSTFDTIILADVLEHVATPEPLWLEMSRVLAPGGRILVSVPFLYWLHDTPHDYYRFTRFALARFVRLAGLELVALEAIGGAPEVLIDILAKHLVRVPALGTPLALAAQQLGLLARKTSLGARLSERTGQSFPFGYFLVAHKPDPALR